MANQPKRERLEDPPTKVRVEQKKEEESPIHHFHSNLSVLIVHIIGLSPGKQRTGMNTVRKVTAEHIAASPMLVLCNHNNVQQLIYTRYKSSKHTDKG